MSRTLPTVVVFGDDDFRTEHTAAHSFVTLMVDGLRHAGADVGTSCDVKRQGASLPSRAWRALKRIPKIPRSSIVIYYGQVLSSLVALAIWCRLNRSVFVPYVVEWPPAVTGRSRLSDLNAKGFGLLVFRLAHGVVLISAELNEKAERAKPELPRIVLPIMADTDSLSERALQSNGPTGSPHSPYVTLCADLNGYLEDALFSIAVVSQTKAPCDLVLIGSPNESAMKQINEMALDKGVAQRVTVLSSLSDIELRNVYAGSAALFMPLRDDERTRARFPSKLGDYLLSARPVVTSKVGEPGRMCAEGEGVVFAREMDPADWAHNLDELLEHPERATTIGKRGASFGAERFDHHRVTSELADFLGQLVKPRQLV